MQEAAEDLLPFHSLWELFHKIRDYIGVTWTRLELALEILPCLCLCVHL